MESGGVQIYHGEILKDYVENALKGITKERFLLKQLHQYVEGPNNRKVCCLYGLRETGKETMMLQELAHIDDYDKCLLLKCEEGCLVMQLRWGIEAYPDCRYIFIEEAVKATDFIDTASVLADCYAAEGKKIILTGTESLGFFIARQDELFDRVHFIHTSYIPFREQHELFGTDIMDYIRYGGTLPAQNVFRCQETAEAYCEAAIVQNIVHSFKKWHYRRYNRGLDRLARNGELSAAVRKVLREKSRCFPENITSDGAAVQKDDGEERTGEIMLPETSSDEQQIIDYLKKLDVLYEFQDLDYTSNDLLIQPGLRYRQVCEITPDRQPEICEHILKEVVLYQMIQTAKAISDKILVSKYGSGVSSGGFDVFAADLKGRVSFILEVTLSDETALCQTKNLTDPDICRRFEHETGTPIRNKIVLYRGKSIFNPFRADDQEKLLQYINIEEFLMHPEEMLQTLLGERILEQKQFDSLIGQ